MSTASISSKLVGQTMPLLELELLRTLVAIAETGNFSAAAAAVYRTPSAVSMQVKKIEEIVGRAVFRRDSRSVTLTAEGELLLEHGRRVLSLNQDVMSRFMAPDIEGVVRLGVTDDIAERSLPELLRRFSRSHCGVTVDVVVDTSVELNKRIKSGEVDLALVTCTPSDGSKQLEIVFVEPLAWAGCKNGVAHEQTPMPLSIWEEGCSWREAALEALTDNDHQYRVSFMCAHLAGQRAALLADLAVAPIPRSSCVNGIVELTDVPWLPPLGESAVGMIVSKKAGPAVLAAAEHLRDSLAECCELA